MRIVSYYLAEINGPRIGLYHEGRVLNLTHAVNSIGLSYFTPTVELFLEHYATYEYAAQTVDKRFREGDFEKYIIENPILLPPVTRPASCRDGYAFRQHVFTARRNRGVPMIPEFDQYPIFYFTNHQAITGPGDVLCMKDHFDKLDFELEAAAIIGKRGRNIRAADADKYIVGYTIMNDWSARTLQMEEMMLNLGPAKGKDFATSIGPMIITPDELESFLIAPPAGHTGNRYNLKMVARVNGVQVSEGNLGDMDWTFAEIIERASYGVTIHPTEIIGSGTVGTGCFLELNGTAKLNNPDAVPQWLQEGDEVELEIEQIGVLKNRIVKESDYSILSRKKNPA